jgi:hypothetical protein
MAKHHDNIIQSSSSHLRGTHERDMSMVPDRSLKAYLARRDDSFIGSLAKYLKYMSALDVALACPVKTKAYVSRSYKMCLRTKVSYTPSSPFL